MMVAAAEKTTVLPPLTAEARKNLMQLVLKQDAPFHANPEVGTVEWRYLKNWLASSLGRTVTATELDGLLSDILGPHLSFESGKSDPHLFAASVMLGLVSPVAYETAVPSKEGILFGDVKNKKSDGKTMRELKYTVEEHKLARVAFVTGVAGKTCCDNLRDRDHFWNAVSKELGDALVEYVREQRSLVAGGASEPKLFSPPALDKSDAKSPANIERPSQSLGTVAVGDVAQQDSPAVGDVLGSTATSRESLLSRFMGRLNRIVERMIADHKYGVVKNDPDAVSQIDAFNRQVIVARRKIREIDVERDHLLRGFLAFRVSVADYYHNSRRLSAERKFHNNEKNSLIAERDTLRSRGNIQKDEHEWDEFVPSMPLTIRQMIRGIALVLIVITVALVGVVAVFRIDNDSKMYTVTDIDPLVAASGEGFWAPGWGPSRNPLAGGDVTARFIDPTPNQALWFMPTLPGESSSSAIFVAVTGGDYDEESKTSVLKEGEYKVEVAVFNDAPFENGQEIEGARLRIGILPSARGFALNRSVFARLAADNAVTVWSGSKIFVDCTCSVTFHNSARLSSNDIPNGVELASGLFSGSGAAVGTRGSDGIVVAGGRSLAAYVTATLVIKPFE